MQTIPTSQTPAQPITTSRSRCGSRHRILPGAYWALAGVLMALVSMVHENWAGTAAVVLFCAVPLTARCLFDMRRQEPAAPQDARSTDHPRSF